MYMIIFLITFYGVDTLASAAIKLNPSLIKAEIKKIEVESRLPRPDIEPGPYNTPESYYKVVLEILSCQTYENGSEEYDLLKGKIIQRKEISAEYKKDQRLTIYIIMAKEIEYKEGDIIEGWTPEHSMFTPILRIVNHHRK